MAETQSCPADVRLHPSQHGGRGGGGGGMTAPWCPGGPARTLWSTGTLRREAAVRHICAKEELGNRKGVGDVVVLAEGAELPYRRVVGSACGWCL